MSDTLERPRIGVALIMLRDGQVLIGERLSPHGAGFWGFPGGHLEHGETWEECIIRECEEETGLVPENVRFWTATNDIFEESGKHYVTLFMVGDYPGGEPEVREPEKCARWQWIHWDSLPENVFLPIRNLTKNGYNPLNL